jgi:nicotinamidase-related amidase
VEEIVMNLPSPPTLLQLRGVSLPLARLSDATLVIIDAQVEYRTGLVPLAGIDRALDRIAALLARARAAGTPILHVRQQGQAGSLFDGDGGAFLPQAAPFDAEPVIVKRLPNAFAGTDLHERLQAIGRRNLILVGFMTHMCVSATARAALDLGHAATIAADCTATRALPASGDGAAIAADVVQRVALAELADRFASVAESAAIGP